MKYLQYWQNHAPSDKDAHEENGYPQVLRKQDGHHCQELDQSQQANLPQGDCRYTTSETGSKMQNMDRKEDQKLI